MATKATTNTIEQQAEQLARTLTTVPLRGIDFVEFWVGDAYKSAYFYMHTFGFQPLAYRGLETGTRDRRSFALKQGKVVFVFTGSYEAGTEVAEHHRKHGDGVKYIAFRVDDAVKSFEETVRRGAEPYMEPRVLEDKHGRVTISGIKTYGETVHLFVDRNNYNGLFLPGFEEWNPPIKTEPIGFVTIDHIVGNVELGKMDWWAEWYARVLGFHRLVSFDDKDISTEYSALMSKVMADDKEVVKFPINEPAVSKKGKSQIQEFLDYYGGPGVQHIALLTKDIIHTVTQLLKRGVEVLYVPDTYYEELPQRVGKIDEPLDKIKELKILVDRDMDSGGYLLQLFTQPLQDRPTFFIEIIQRKYGARSFGKGNFKALFESIEREQRRRGNL